MATVKNKRVGRIRIYSGDATPLEKVADFDMGDWQHGEGFPTNPVISRGKVRGVTPGDDQLVTWQFSARLTDKTLYRCLRDKVWAAQTESFAGLTAGQNNVLTPAYDYEQGSLEVASGETGTKLAAGATPSADNEFAEATGTVERIEGVTVVAKADGINVYQPAADVDRDVVYDAVGQSTLSGDACAGRKAVKIVLQIYDPCDPPSPTDFDAGTILETYTLDDAILTSSGLTEGDEADIVAFSGIAVIDRVAIATI